MADENPGSSPASDPTALTTDALEREVRALRQLVDQRITALRELVEEELEGNDKVTEERFASIDTQFQLIERQRVEQKTDTQSALGAALSAAEKAVREQTTASEARTDKSEAATTKAIEQLAATFQLADAAQRRDTDDLKTRMTTVEQQKVGRVEETQESRALLQPFQVIIASLVGTGVISLLVYLASRGHP